MSEHTTTAEQPRPPEDTAELPHGITLTEIRNEVAKVRRLVINPKLGVHASRFGDNVESETLFAVWKTVAEGKFNPKLSPLGYWVRMTAERKVLDELRQITTASSWKSDQLFRAHPDKSVDLQMEEAIHHSARSSEPDAAELYAEIEAIRVWLLPVLKTCTSVMDQRKFFRAFMCYFRFDGDPVAAADALGASAPAHIRANVREFKVHMQVIHQALQAKGEGRPGSLRTMIDCLPQADEAGGHRRRIGEAVRAWVSTGQPFSAVTVDFVVEHTGDSYNTIRQRLGEVLNLLRVAYTVITSTTDTYQAMT